MLEHSLDHSGTRLWLFCGGVACHPVWHRTYCVMACFFISSACMAHARNRSCVFVRFHMTFALLPLLRPLLNGCCAVRCNDQIRDAMLYHVFEQHARFFWEMCGGAASQGRHALCDALRSFPQGACYGLRVHRCVHRPGDKQLGRVGQHRRNRCVGGRQPCYIFNSCPPWPRRSHRRCQS